MVLSASFCTTTIDFLPERISADLSSLFDDVVDEFHEVSRIKARFESWRAKQRDSYEEAYIGLCLPKLFTPLVRLKLISWNPLEVRSTFHVIPRISDFPVYNYTDLSFI